jgi:hypothetical protein
LQLFEGNPEQGYDWKQDLVIFSVSNADCDEADFEALTRHGDDFFAITSHSRDRKKQKPKELSYEKNRARLQADGIKDCDTRHQLLELNTNGTERISEVKATSLKKVIRDNSVLKPFAALPDKENGIDIEGLAATDNNLLVGFRGPVLRENLVPVLRLGFDLQPIQSEFNPLFVDLGGRGIRDLTAGPDGNSLYVLAGPNGDEKQSSAIYLWDGKDAVGGTDHPTNPAVKRCDLGTYGSVKPEGIAYFDSGASGERVLLVFDGGNPPTAKLVTLGAKN